MKIACSSWSYHRSIERGQMTLMDVIEEASRLEFDGVEILCDHLPSQALADLAEVKRACAERFLEIAMFSGRGELSTPDDRRRTRAEVPAIGYWMDMCLFMGAPVLRILVGKAQELEAGGAELQAKVAAALSDIALMGQQRGIILAMENHGDTTAEQMLSLLSAVNSPWLKLMVDTGNFPPKKRVGPDTYSSIERCAPHAAFTHFKFYNIAPDGKDMEFDHDRIIRILCDAGYRGPLCLEYEGAEDERGAVERIAECMRGWKRLP